MRKTIYILVFTVMIVFFLYYLFLEKKFYNKVLMNNNSSVLKLSNFTNFEWDYVELSVSNEDFKKISFYKNDQIIFKENLLLSSDGGVRSQYLFTMRSDDKGVDLNYSYYRCSNNALIKLNKIDFLNERKVILYIYEPINCTPYS